MVTHADGTTVTAANPVIGGGCKRSGCAARAGGGSRESRGGLSAIALELALMERCGRLGAGARGGGLGSVARHAAGRASAGPPGRRSWFGSIAARCIATLYQYRHQQRRPFPGRQAAGKPEQFLKSQFEDRFPAFSPDSRWLAYESNASGKGEVYVRPFPPPASGQGGLWPISNGGGTFPVWSPNGRDLLYQSGDQIMAVSYTVKGDAFVPEKPRVWIAKLGAAADQFVNTPRWGLAPDDKRVAVITPVEALEAPKPDHTVVFLQNFFDYLRQRVPMEK